MQSSFLQDVAQALYDKYGKDISDLNIVFPSRRAERYFTIALDRIGCRARPSFSTIDTLMQRFSELKPADELVVISHLYNIYKEFHKNETFDKFYSFGKLLISDFDSIDKYMVDASKLYSIVSDTFDIENKFQDSLHNHAFRFWESFEHKKATSHKEQYFLRIWGSLFEIYNRLQTKLTQSNEAYAGMVYRDTANKIGSTDLSNIKKLIFVGLNALSESEKIVLKELQKNQKAEFIWDFDPEWIENDKETAYFIRKNIIQFPQVEYYKSNNTQATPEIEVIATPTDILQCKVSANILQKIAVQENKNSLDEKTAIVLTDENLLLPLLHSLPSVASNINISIGFPLASTLAYLFIERIISLQATSNKQGFYHTDVTAILSHPFISDKIKTEEIATSKQLYIASEKIASNNDNYKIIFDKIEYGYFTLHNYLERVINLIINNVTNISEEEKHALDIILKSMTKLISTIQNCNIELSTPIYISLLKQSIKSQSIPYEGKSGNGVQIMGILETRALDFDNIIMLSMSDDNFPNAKSPSSYIPQNLRIAYGLPTIEEHSAIWSYYFYRLFQKAKKIELLYCNASNSATPGEQSRYIYQLLYNSKYDIKESSLNFQIERDTTPNEISVHKTAEIVSELRVRKYSPSAINRYINCPLAFYFSDVASIETEEDAIENEVTSLDIGSALHKTMEALYKILGANHTIKNISRQEIKQTTHRIMGEICGEKQSTLAPTIALSELAIGRMVENIVNYDTHNREFTIMDMEKTLSCNISGITVKGTIDRIDRMDDGSIRVIDYKSGGNKWECKSIEGLINGTQKEHNEAILQILTYCLIANENFSAPITAELYVARKMGRVQIQDQVIRIGGERQAPISNSTLDEIEEKIGAILQEITNPEIPFFQSANKPDSCAYCAYKPICQI